MKDHENLHLLASQPWPLRMSTRPQVEGWRLSSPVELPLGLDPGRHSATVHCTNRPSVRGGGNNTSSDREP